MQQKDKITRHYIEIVKAMTEAFNRQNIELLLSYLDDDIYWDDPAMEEPVRGIYMFKSFVLSFWESFPDVRYISLQEVFSSPDQDKIVHWFTIKGTMLGQLSPGFAPTGRRFEVEGLEMIEFREEKISRIITRIDGLKVAEQLRLLPPRLKVGSRKARIAVFFQRPIAWYLRLTAKQL